MVSTTVSAAGSTAASAGVSFATKSTAAAPNSDPLRYLFQSIS